MCVPRFTVRPVPTIASDLGQAQLLSETMRSLCGVAWHRLANG